MITAITSLHSIEPFVFLMDTDWVMCEAKTELLYSNLLSFVLQMAEVFSSVWIAVCF